MSSSIYDTFGNTLKYDIIEDTLVAYLENSTVKFPLPEASSELLANLTQNVNKTFDPAKLSMVYSKLQKAGFKKPAAKAMSDVIMAVADSQGIDPLEYFSVNSNSLNLTVDAYNAINTLRPAGSRVGLTRPVNNINSKAARLIKP